MLSFVVCCCCPDFVLFPLFRVLVRHSSSLLAGGRFVDESHKFCSMGGVDVVVAESVTMGNHNF